MNKNIAKALKVAKDNNLLADPELWKKFIDSGWEVRVTPCECGGNLAWVMPDALKGLKTYGCVCHNELSLNKLFESKRDDFSPLIIELLQKSNLKMTDVGKIFYIHSSMDSGVIVDQFDFMKLDPVTISWWLEINEFHIF